MLKVVIIDSNTITRNLLSTLLVAGGHEVIGDFGTGDANVARAIKLRPQILCIDIGPVLDHGLVLLDLLRNALPKTLVFLVSANMDAATVQGAAQRGVHGFIVKPFNPVTVQNSIRNAVLKLARQLQAQAATVPSTMPASPPSQTTTPENPALDAAPAQPEDTPDSKATDTGH